MRVRRGAGGRGAGDANRWIGKIGRLVSNYCIVSLNAAERDPLVAVMFTPPVFGGAV
jgi:hypothetical protein